MAKIVQRETVRNCKCRVCGKAIPIGEQTIVIERTYVAGNYLSLFFHPDCILNGILATKAYTDICEHEE